MSKYVLCSMCKGHLAFIINAIRRNALCVIRFLDFSYPTGVSGDSACQSQLKYRKSAAT